MESRLTTFLARFEAQQQLTEARTCLQGHQKAHEELQSSPCLATALEHTLALGNFLNWGTRLGQAAGFRLRKLQVRVSLTQVLIDEQLDRPLAYSKIRQLLPLFRTAICTKWNLSVSLCIF